MDFAVGIVSRNLAITSNFVEFRDSRNFTFFKAPGVECRKTTCDVTRVTYYIYPCDTCCMSRERMRWMVEIVQSVKNQEKGHIGN